MTIDRTVLRDGSGECLRRPVVYLDQSHLSDAFDGKRGIDGPNAALNAELALIIEEVAGTGTLCLSSVHIVETANRPRLDEAVGLARWLDALEPRWFQTQGADEQELAYEVWRRLGLDGLENVPPRLPIHRAMTAAMHENLGSVSVAGSVDLLSDPTMAGAIRKAHLKLDREVYAKQSLAIFEKLHVDRSNLTPGTTSEDVAARARLKLGWQLQIDGRNVRDARPIIVLERRPTDQEITDAVLALLDELAALPLNKVASHVLRNVGEMIADQTLGSGSFEIRYGSFAMDMRHALAGAVVDVFTCDKFMGGVMGDFRTTRGMKPQLSLHGRDRATLVRELRAQCAERPADA